MRRVFYTSLLAGVALTVLAASVFPLPQHHRYRSSISVLPNGGRQEDFVIEWPRDRVQLGTPASPQLLVSGAGLVRLPGPTGPLASAELFRLRDSAGNVVGLASRTTAEARGPSGASAQTTTWMLMLPSRGALFLRQVNGIDTAPRPRVPGGQLGPPQDAVGFWARGTRYRITNGPLADGAGEVVHGTEEFAGLQGSYEEVWDLAEVTTDGATRGRILLSTRTIARP